MLIPSWETIKLLHNSRESKEELEDLVDNRTLYKYMVSPSEIESFCADLKLIGITKTTVFQNWMAWQTNWARISNAL